MEPDAVPADDNSLGQRPPAPWMRPSISRNRVVTIRRPVVPLRPRETRVPATREIRAYCCILPGCASNACQLSAPVDAGRCVSSVRPGSARASRAGDRALAIANLSCSGAYWVGEDFGEAAEI